MNKNLIILGLVGIGIYLATRKKEKITYTKELVMALSDADLQALLIDLGKKESQDKYTDPSAYSFLVVNEIERRKKTAVVTPTPATISPIKTSTTVTTNYGPSTGVVAPMGF